MNWNSFLYLVLVLLIAYAPYKYIQRFGDLMNITFQNALLASTVMSVSVLLLLTDIAQSAISLNGILISTSGAIFLSWFAIPYIFPKLGQYPTQLISPPNGIILASVRFPLFLVKFVEVILQEVVFLYVIFVVMGNLNFYERIFAFTGALMVMHFINILFTTNKKLAVIVVFLSIPMGIVFGVLILKGYFLLSVALHLAFYVSITSYAWFGKRLAWQR
ncbi:hypothetical protein KBD81_02870 [Candidatus Woesebacteria bacterium]|nr:hypothetical protein [Candidatus Woesebacteria bacterium]